MSHLRSLKDMILIYACTSLRRELQNNWPLVWSLSKTCSSTGIFSNSTVYNRHICRLFLLELYGLWLLITKGLPYSYNYADRDIHFALVLYSAQGKCTYALSCFCRSAPEVLASYSITQSAGCSLGFDAPALRIVSLQFFKLLVDGIPSRKNFRSTARVHWLPHKSMNITRIHSAQWLPQHLHLRQTVNESLNTGDVGNGKLIWYQLETG